LSCGDPFSPCGRQPSASAILATPLQGGDSITNGIKLILQSFVFGFERCQYLIEFVH
jgi:hypothetical protein